MKKIRNKLVVKFKILFVISVLILMSSTSIFSAEKTSEEDSLIPEYTNEDNEITITFELSDVVQTQISHANEVFTILTIPNSGFIGELGKPQIPLCTELYAVPNNYISIEIIKTHILETRNVGRMYPAQHPQMENKYSKDISFEYDEEFYQRDISYPNSLVEIIDTGKIRDVPFVRIGFSPIIYNPKQQMVTIYDKISIKLKYAAEKVEISNHNFERSAFYPLYENVFTNWNEFKDTIVIKQNSNSHNFERVLGCDYLIITHPNFYSQIKDLGEWKHKKGLMTKIVNVTDIGSSASTIRTYIQNAYDTWTPQPSYLLLVGDSEFIPTNYMYSAASDLWYATVDGSDYYADLYFGRISVDTVNQANIVAQKTITYEQSPPTQSNFYNDFSVSAYFQDDEENGYETRRFVRTSEELRDYLQSIGYSGERTYVTESYITPTHYNNGWYGNGEPLPSDLLRPGFAWDGDAGDIINAIENGIFILNHRDHGFEYGWGDPYFDTSHIASLTNGNLLPVVFSINCLTGRFDGYECFSEDFIRKNNGGAVAVFGATRISYSGYNDYLCRGFYDAIWPNFDTTVGTNTPMYDLGAILNYGKYYMANTWGNPWGEERYSFELFHVFGDPELSIWTDLPEDFVVTHPNELSMNTTSFSVHVEDIIGYDIEDASVCLWKGDEIYLTDYTDNNGNVTFYPNPLTPGTMFITITKHNFIAYSVEIPVNLENQPPHIPSNPSPSNGSTYVDVDADLSWTGGDPDPGDTVTYDVYFEADDPTPDVMVSNNQSGTTYDSGTMDGNTQYYWKIVSWDNHGAYAEGPIWDFTTENNPPNTPSNPNPADGATDVGINVDLSWTCSDPDGDNLTYNVYFEANDPTPDELVSGNQTGTTYDPGNMNYNTHYYWKIVAWDEYGASTTGPIWDFTTGSEPNDPPYPPTDPDPEDGATGVDIDAGLSWNCSDPDGDELTYDVYLEANDSTPDVLVSNDQTGTTYDPDGLEYGTLYYWQIIAKDSHSATTSGPIWSFTTEKSTPDLDCSGDLHWIDVQSGATVTDEITVENIGEPGSLLDWEIDEHPDWGDWTFTPSNGDDLLPNNPFTVGVTVIAPDDPNADFTGEVKIVNSEDPDDYCIIDVSLATPVNQQVVINPLLQMILERFPNAFPILRHLLAL